jgi:hypothetical protein
VPPVIQTFPALSPPQAFSGDKRDARMFSGGFMENQG